MSQQLIQTFYTAFSKFDAETMTNCYHDDVVFEDPAFGALKGTRAKNMWKMLCGSQDGKDFKVSCSDITEDSAKWEAFYTFSQTNKKVHNKVTAHFEFKDGKIIKHTDHFNLHNWAKQALGFKGLLLGGTSFFKKKLNTQTNGILSKFEKKS